MSTPINNFEPNEQIARQASQPDGQTNAAIIPKMNDQQLVEDSFYCKFDKDIYQYTKGINENIDEWQVERDIVLAKIQSIAEGAFKGQDPKIRQFGSLMTGLALECSDMDMAVTGLNIIDR
jgi:DNA polymerase sigma